MRVLLHLIFATTLAWSGEPIADLGPSAPESQELQGEAARLRDNMVRRAQREAWSGVEASYTKLTELGASLHASDHLLGAQASLVAGDPWLAYQRLVRALQIDAEAPQVRESMADIRGRFGRLTVRRVEATPITFDRDEAPFAPDERAAVGRAADQLALVGGFDGMVPVGTYLLGSRTITVEAGLKPLVVQRQLGDGTSKP